MARRTLQRWDRLPGWPPGRADQPRPRDLSLDDVVLAILWALVMAGLAALAVLTIFGLFGEGGYGVGATGVLAVSPPGLGTALSALSGR